MRRRPLSATYADFGCVARKALLGWFGLDIMNSVFQVPEYENLSDAAIGGLRRSADNSRLAL
jgi:hypothetical protein